MVLKEWLDAAWAEVGDSRLGCRQVAADAGGAASSFTCSRPTYSFREIADQSFVSQNTVKTQAQSVYRKLGVSSRAEAVACAQAAGLLDTSAEDSPEPGDVPSVDGA